MAVSRGDNKTMDLLAWEGEHVVDRYDLDRVRTSTLRDKIARAVSETLTDAEPSREDIAGAMSKWLGEDVTKNMLDAYASEAREDHTIPYLRLLALVHVTGDLRPLQMGAELFQHSVIHDRYQPWIEVGIKAEIKIEADKDLDFARRLARKGVRG